MFLDGILVFKKLLNIQRPAVVVTFRLLVKECVL